MSDERYDDLFQAENEKPTDYKALFFEYLMYWPWFVACLIICLAGAWCYLRYQAPVYNVNATVLIKINLEDKMPLWQPCKIWVC